MNALCCKHGSTIQEIVGCHEESVDAGSFLRAHAHLLLPSLLSKQTAARLVIQEHSQSANLHSQHGREEFLIAKKLLRSAQEEMREFATVTGTATLLLLFILESVNVLVSVNS